MLNPDGQQTTTVVAGNSLTGLYAPDGSWNIVLNNGSTLTGLSHPCGAYNAVIVTDPYAPYHNANGSINVIANNFGGYSPVSPRGIGVYSSTPAWVPSSIASASPDIYVNYATNQAWYKAGSLSTTAIASTNVSRSSNQTMEDSLGNWSTFAPGALARTDLGFYTVTSRTNSIRNNTMAGAVAMADGVELNPNPDFTLGSGSWVTSGNATFSGAGLTVTGNGVDFTNNASLQLTGLVPGRQYVIKAVGGSNLAWVAGGSAPASNIYSGSSYATIQPNGTNSAFSDRYWFTAPANGIAYVTVARFNSGTSVIPGISIQDGERIQNNTFSVNPISASASTVQNGWQWSGNVAPVWSAPSVQIAGDGAANTSLIQGIPTINGFTYTISADITANPITIQIGTTAGASNIGTFSTSVGTGQKFQFTATGSISYISFKRSAITAAVIANVSVQSAGVLPTNWVWNPNNGLMRNILAVGTTQGLPTIDIQVFGTTTASATMQINIDPASAKQIAASYGQTWTISGFYQTLLADPNVTGNITFEPWTFASDGSTFIGTNVGAPFAIATTTALTRSASSTTFPAVTTAYLSPFVRLATNIPGGVRVDYRFRIGAPQLELNTGSVSSVASASITAGGTGGTTGTAVYSVGGGSGTAATLNVTVSGGVITAINSVASAGSYSTFPTSPATLTYVSGTATAVTGATVTLVPADASSVAFATNPILTSSGAVSRGGETDILNLNGGTFGSSYSGYVSVTVKDSSNSTESMLEFNDATATNRVSLRRTNKIPQIGGAGTLAVAQTASGSPVWSQGSFGKLATGLTSGNTGVSFNGSISDGSNVFTGTPVQVNVGQTIGPGNIANSYIKEIAIWFNQRLTDTQLQSITT